MGAQVVHKGYYVKERGVHRSVVFFKGRGVYLTRAACLLWHSHRYMERLNEKAFAVTSRLRYYNYVRPVEVGSIAEGANGDAMLVEVRAEQCNAESLDSMQTETGIKKPQYIQSRNRKSESKSMASSCRIICGKVS